MANGNHCKDACKPATSCQSSLRGDNVVDLQSIVCVTAMLACAGATALTCTSTSGSPSSADCQDVAEYLLSRPSGQQCERTSAGTSNCTPLYNSGTCVASICGTEGQGISCQDAGTDVAALVVGCATGGGGTLESTTTAGSLIPWGNGNLLITIDHV